MSDRYVYVQHLHPDHVEEYREAHEAVPAGVRSAMERGGVTEFEVYLRDTVVVCILECEDLDAYLSAIEGDPAVEQWERRVAEFKESGVDADASPDQGIPFAEPVWSFSP